MMPVKYGTVCDIESYCIKTDELFWFVPASAAAAGVGFKCIGWLCKQQWVLLYGDGWVIIGCSTVNGRLQWSTQL